MGLFDFLKKERNIKKSGIIYSPTNGEIKPICETPDQMFAKKLIGDGAIIFNSDGNIIAPFDGKVKMLFPTKHAIGLESNDGIEILIHYGINTVELKGEGFRTYVKQGGIIKTGNKLLVVDNALLESRGLITCVIIAVTYPKDIKIEMLKNGIIQQKEEIIQVIK